MVAASHRWVAASPIWVRGAALVAVLLAAYATFDIMRVLRSDIIVGTVTGILESRPEQGLLSDLFVFDQGPSYVEPRVMSAIVRVTGENHQGSVVLVRGLPFDQVREGAQISAWMRGSGEAAWSGPGLGNFRHALIALALAGVAWFSAWSGTERWRKAGKAKT